MSDIYTCACIFGNKMWGGTSKYIYEDIIEKMHALLSIRCAFV